MRGVMQRLGHGAAHETRAADRAIEPRVLHHLDDDRHAATFLAEKPRVGAVELDLGRRVRAVAELVLEADDAHRVARAVRQQARQEEARESRAGLREHEMRVAHRRREEPLVSGEPVAPVGVALGAGEVGANVGAALALGHAHADQCGGFVGDG